VFVLDDILLSPLTGLIFLARKIAEKVDREQNDEATVMKQLLEVQLLYEMDEISEEEYETREAELIKKLTLIKEQALNQLEEQEEDAVEEDAVEEDTVEEDTAEADDEVEPEEQGGG